MEMACVIMQLIKEVFIAKTAGILCGFLCGDRFLTKNCITTEPT